MNNLKHLVLLLTLSILPAQAGIEKQYEKLKTTTTEKMEVMDQKMDQIYNKVEKLSGEAKIEMRSQYRELMIMKNNLKAKLEKAGEATTDEWDSVKDEVEDYADSLESKIDESIEV